MAQPPASGRRLRIAIVTQYFFPEEFRINDLVSELVARGHDVHVLTGNPNYPSGKFVKGYGGPFPRRERLFGASVVRVPHAARGDSSGAHLMINYITFALSATFFGPLLMRGHFDVVMTNQPSPLTVAVPGLLLARLKRAPAVLWVQDLWPQTLLAMGVLRSQLLKRVVTRLAGYLHRGMSSVLIQSPAFHEPLVKQGVSPDRIKYVPNWAEDFYHPILVPNDAPERAVMPAGFNVLFAGNLGEAQGIETLVGAMYRLRDIEDLHWIVLGDGRRSGWLRGQIELTGLTQQVSLLGRRPVETMPTWFALADVLIATLRSDPVFNLTIPSKLQSYLACGRPIVAGMDGEGARVVQEASAGSTAPAGDPDALAAAVRGLYESSTAVRGQMGNSAEAYYQKHFARTGVIGSIETVMTRDVSRWQGGGKK